MNLDMQFSDEFDMNKLDSNDKATFLHEYIHYLQDISTTSGIANLNHMISMINLYLSKAYEEKTHVIEIPIDLKNCGIENAYQQRELMNIYLGYDEHKKINHVNKVCKVDEEIYNEEFNINSDSNQKMSIINIYYDDKEYPYVFGKVCVSESIAYLIESHVFNIENRVNEFPYNSCELICEKIYPEISKKYNVIVAICDIALMHYDSGRFFYDAILDMKKNSFIPKSVDDVWCYLNGRIDHLFDDYLKEYNNSDKKIDFLYSKDLDITKSVNIWLKDKLSIAYKMRNEERKFISKIMDIKSQDDAYKYFCQLVNQFSLPLVKDKLNYVYGQDINVNLPLILAPIALGDIFTKINGFKCSIYEICEVNKEKNLCSNCINQPWKQVDKEELCPFALYWYRFSLSDKSLKYKTLI